MRRFQARRSSGRFTRNTLQNTFGLHAGACPACGRFNPHGVDEPHPELCKHCGALLAVCADGRCTTPFVDPAVALSGGYKECGKPAAGYDIVHRWPVCEEHGAPVVPTEAPTALPADGADLRYALANGERDPRADELGRMLDRLGEGPPPGSYAPWRDKEKG